MKLKPADVKIDPQKCLGNWYVQRAIPAAPFLEKDVFNGVETYEWDDVNKRLKVRYAFNQGSFDGKLVKSYQRGWVVNDLGTEWAVYANPTKHVSTEKWPIENVSPKLFAGFHLPFKLSYYIVDIAPDYSYLTAAAPSGWWLYVMTREQEVSEEDLAPRLETVKQLGFDLSKLVTVPQKKV